MASGDTCPRAMIIAAVMASSDGLESIPDRLIAGFNKAPEI